MAGLFVGLFGFLAIRVAQGQDPALQPHPTQVAAVRPVIVRRVVVTRHVTVYRPAVKPRRPVASAAAAPC